MLALVESFWATPALKSLNTPPISRVGRAMEAHSGKTKKRVSICETQPLMVNGLRHLLDSTDDLEFGASHASPAEWMLSPGANATDVLIIDKGLGAKTVLEALGQLPA